MNSKKGGPAFPVPFTFVPSWDGMDLRDWFAGQALAGLTGDVGDPNEPVIAKMCYAMADAMLAERNKRRE